MKVRDVLKLLEKDGWILKSTVYREASRIEKMSQYAVIFEKSSNGWGAYVPDLPGCVALAFTLEETKSLIREALKQHLAAMRPDGDPIPEPSQVELVEVA